LVLFC